MSVAIISGESCLALLAIRQRSPGPSFTARYVFKVGEKLGDFQTQTFFCSGNIFGENKNIDEWEHMGPWVKHTVRFH